MNPLHPRDLHDNRPDPGATLHGALHDTRRGEADALACVRCRRPLRRATRQKAGPDPRGRVWVAFKRWQGGWICSGCYATACETYGPCAACGSDRLLPGLGPDGQRWCTNCAGLGNFTCSRCGQEGWLHSRGSVCARCVLKDRLALALDDGTGQIRPELVPLFDLITAMGRPRAGLLWLSRPHVPALLGAIARAQVPLTHEGIAGLSPAKSATYVRDLLVTAGVLPSVDRHLFAFEQWLPAWLAQIEDPEQRQLLTAYATWRLLRDLRTIAADAPVGHYREQIARRRLRVAASFLEVLHSRDLPLAGCTQPVLDEWFAQATQADRALQRHFLRWAQQTQRMPVLELPATTANTPTPITQRERLEWIRRVHAGDGMDLTERVVALLVLLYAQPLSKVARLTVEDITVVDGQMLLRLGDPPAPVPAPFDALLSEHLATRPNLMTATNPNSRWLFPGRRAGEPMHPTTFRLRFQKLGIPNLTGRSRALRAMLLQAPPSVVAGMLGYRPDKAEEIARGAGATWKRYAAGNHDRSRRPTI